MGVGVGEEGEREGEGGERRRKSRTKSSLVSGLMERRCLRAASSDASKRADSCARTVWRRASKTVR